MYLRLKFNTRRQHRLKVLLYSINIDQIRCYFSAHQLPLSLSSITFSQCASLSSCSPSSRPSSCLRAPVSVKVKDATQQGFTRVAGGSGVCVALPLLSFPPCAVVKNTSICRIERVPFRCSCSSCAHADVFKVFKVFFKHDFTLKDTEIL
eukprot:IDg4489t1